MGVIRTVERINHIAQASQRAQQRNTAPPPQPVAPPPNPLAGKIYGPGHIVPGEDADPGQDLGEAGILDEAAEFIGDYVSATQAQTDAMLLYAAATHALTAFPAFGRMLFTSLSEESGKTRAMEITAALCANPQDGSGTPYALQSELAAAANEPEKPMPSFYYDEIGSVYGDSGLLKGSNKTLDDVLKKGYRNGATSSWSVNRTKQSFSIFCPFLVTGLRTSIPRDIRSRTIVIQMQHGSPRRYFDVREAQPHAKALAESLAAAVMARTTQLAEFRARGIHPRLRDRKLEVWEPLCAVAYILGGQRWLNRCITAFRDLALAQSDTVVLSPKQQVIRDAAEVTEASDRKHVLEDGSEFIGGLTLIDELHRLDNPLYQSRTDASLAQLISDALPMNTVQLTVSDGKRVRGYYAADILDAWDKIRPDDPEDAEIPEEVNPFEVDDEDEARTGS